MGSFGLECASMQKNVLVSAILVVIILLGGLAYWALERGVLYFEEGDAFPRFSLEALKNPFPDLDRRIVYPDSFPQELRADYETRRAELVAQVEADPSDLSAWFNLALNYRMVNDHEGAVQIWKYLVSQNPREAVSLHNLGEYYFHTEKDYPKAEEYYELSIAANPGLTVNYTDLHEMYRYVYKQDTTAAIDILERGIANLKTNESIVLQVALGRYYRDVLSDAENARIHLGAARDAAQARGDRSTANELQREIDAL